MAAGRSAATVCGSSIIPKRTDANRRRGSVVGQACLFQREVVRPLTRALDRLTSRAHLPSLENLQELVNRCAARPRQLIPLAAYLASGSIEAAARESGIRTATLRDQLAALQRRLGALVAVGVLGWLKIL
jgi:hypothetical protein